MSKIKSYIHKAWKSFVSYLSTHTIEAVLLLVITCSIAGAAVFGIEMIRRFDIAEVGSEAMDSTGQIGDFFGGIFGSIWSLVGVLLFYIALRYQRKEFALQREEFKNQKIEFQLNRISTSILQNGININRSWKHLVDSSKHSKFLNEHMEKFSKILVEETNPMSGKYLFGVKEVQDWIPFLCSDEFGNFLMTFQETLNYSETEIRHFTESNARMKYTKVRGEISTMANRLRFLERQSFNLMEYILRFKNYLGSTKIFYQYADDFKLEQYKNTMKLRIDAMNALVNAMESINEVTIVSIREQREKYN